MPGSHWKTLNSIIRVAYDNQLEVSSDTAYFVLQNHYRNYFQVPCVTNAVSSNVFGASHCFFQGQNAELKFSSSRYTHKHKIISHKINFLR